MCIITVLEAFVRHENVVRLLELLGPSGGVVEYPEYLLVAEVKRRSVRVIDLPKSLRL